VVFFDVKRLSLPVVSEAWLHTSAATIERHRRTLSKYWVIIKVPLQIARE